MMKTIHVVGTSHTWFFTGTEQIRGLTWYALKPPDSVPGIKTYNVGAVLAWSLATDNIGTITALPIGQGEQVLMVFGEIDCRWEIAKRCRNMCDVFPRVQECLHRYEAALDLLNKSYRIMCWAVTPPNRIKAIPHKSVSQNAVMRAAITETWNTMLEQYCGENGIPFISIYDKLLREDGLVDPQYFGDLTHLNHTAWPIAYEELHPYMATKI